MRDEVLELYRDMTRMVETATGKPARLTVDEPTTLRDDGGRYQRVGAIWFLQHNGDGKPTNHGFHLDVYRPDRMRMETWGKGSRATIQLYGQGCQDTVSMGRILYALLPAALRPETDAML
jgi:hypothetical protein